MYNLWAFKQAVSIAGPDGPKDEILITMLTRRQPSRIFWMGLNKKTILLDSNLL